MRRYKLRRSKLNWCRYGNRPSHTSHTPHTMDSLKKLCQIWVNKKCWSHRAVCSTMDSRLAIDKNFNPKPLPIDSRARSNSQRPDRDRSDRKVEQNSHWLCAITHNLNSHVFISLASIYTLNNSSPPLSWECNAGDVESLIYTNAVCSLHAIKLIYYFNRVIDRQSLRLGIIIPTVTRAPLVSRLHGLAVSNTTFNHIPNAKSDIQSGYPRPRKYDGFYYPGWHEY